MRSEGSQVKSSWKRSSINAIQISQQNHPSILAKLPLSLRQITHHRLPRLPRLLRLRPIRVRSIHRTEVSVSAPLRPWHVPIINGELAILRRIHRNAATVVAAMRPELADEFECVYRRPARAALEEGACASSADNRGWWCGLAWHARMRALGGRVRRLTTLGVVLVGCMVLDAVFEGCFELWQSAVAQTGVDVDFCAAFCASGAASAVDS